MEASVSMAVLLLFFSLFFGMTYGILIQGISYSDGATTYLRNNHHPVTESTLQAGMRLSYTEVEDFKIRTFTDIEDTFMIEKSGFENSAEYVVFVTDTGLKFHKPYCPTVQLSLHPMLYDQAIRTYAPCSICN